mmetsp:Transcript_11949/g.24273  ORF Transcript_11949/g.24273 Transcript_11949/m.24273 type:complete len:218 (-) Transcript_11949:922-1575(-)
MLHRARTRRVPGLPKLKTRDGGRGRPLQIPATCELGAVPLLRAVALRRVRIGRHRAQSHLPQGGVAPGNRRYLGHPHDRRPLDLGLQRAHPRQDQHHPPARVARRAGHRLYRRVHHGVLPRGRARALPRRHRVARRHLEAVAQDHDGRLGGLVCDAPLPVHFRFPPLLVGLCDRGCAQRDARDAAGQGRWQVRGHARRQHAHQRRGLHVPPLPKMLP